jgi:hypothetical protein
VGHVSRTWRTHTWCDTQGRLVVEPRKTTQLYRRHVFRPSLDSKLGGGSSSGNWRLHMASSRMVHQGEVTSCAARGC